MMKHLVEKPNQTRENLNFDYSKTSPVAFVPLKDNVGDKTHISGARAIPYNHKLQLTVSLTLPESEYNQKLGVFQVLCPSNFSSFFFPSDLPLMFHT